MKKHVFIGLLAIAAMAAACTKIEAPAPVESEGLVQRDFSALVTKTALSGNSVVWQDDDEISVFAGGTANAAGGAEYELKSSSGSSATFTGSVAEATEYYAVYPYSASNAYDGTATLTASVPVEQVITSGSFAPGAAVVVGRSGLDYTFPFQNAVALLKVTLDDSMSGASKIEVSGNNGEAIAGAFTAAYSGSAFSFADAASGTSTTVSLVYEGGSFVGGQPYYIAIRPQSFSKGLTAKVYFPQGGGDPDKIAVKTSEAAVTINAGQILPLGTFTGTNVWAPSLGYGDNEIFTLGDNKYVSFNYGDSKVFPVANVSSIDLTGIASGWSASFDSSTSKLTVTAPAASPAGSYPPGPLGLKLVSSEGNEATPALNVRLYGIGSVAELQAADHIMQDGASGDISDYTVTTAGVQELFLTADLTLATSDLRSNAIALHHNDYPINGNGRTVTFDNVTVGAWPTGFIQNMLHDVHDLNLSGAITSTYISATTTNRPLIGALAARAMTNDVVVTNVTSDVDITYAATSSPAFIGGLVGYMATGNKSITFKECTVSGDIVCNAEVTAIGGIIAQGETKGTDANAWTTFEDCLWEGTLTYRPDATLTNTTDRRTRIGGIVGNSERQLKAIRTYSRGRIDVYLDNKIFGSSSHDRAVGGWFGRSAAASSGYYMAFYVDDVRSSTHTYVHGVNANEVKDCFQIRGYGLCSRTYPEGATNTNIILEGSPSIHFEDYAGPEINGAGSTVSFAYGTAQDIQVTTDDLTDWTVTPVAPTGWTVDAAHIKDASPYITVTPPTQAAIQAGTAVGTGGITFNVSDGTNSYTPTAGSGVSVRLYGINSAEEFNTFYSTYGQSSDYSSSTHDTRSTNCALYLVNDEITLNADIVAASVSNYYIKHLEHNINGNGKSLTMTVSGSAWPVGFCQNTYGDLKIYDLVLKGTVTWTYLETSTTSGVASAFVVRPRGGLEFENVSSEVDILWNRTTDAATDALHSIGGLVAEIGAETSYPNTPVSFKDCNVLGTITQKCWGFCVGGFIGHVAGNTKATVIDISFDHCTFGGTIDWRTNRAYTEAGSKAYGRIGSFLGATDAVSHNVYVKGCTVLSGATIHVEGGAQEVGGFMGRINAVATLEDDADGNHNVFSGTIEYIDKYEKANAYGLIGGFFGNKGGTLNMTNCDGSLGAISLEVVGASSYSPKGILGNASINSDVNNTPVPSSSIVVTEYSE
ncbi:MAG: hypothetical protein IJQ93_06075 [Bacteroidales bacterium]|nr:hypothetical protein [Bacteroidales bacterium]